jgi:hypothetical protein
MFDERQHVLRDARITSFGVGIVAQPFRLHYHMNSIACLEE